MKRQKSPAYVVVAFLFLWLPVIACSRSFVPVNATEAPGPTGSIVYASDESGNFEIYNMNVNTHAKTRLTDNTSDEASPFYFPTARFGFVSDKSGKYQIYTMELDGSDQKIWKKDDKHGFFTPSISPDSSQVAYIVQSSEKVSNLYVSNLDGKGDEKLATRSGMVWDPSWSPDGRKIAFSSDSGGDWEVAILNVDTKKVTYLTKNTSFDGRPRWSPDGSQILFDSDRDGDWEIYVMDTNGENVRAITENSAGDWGANWSPDGQWIVYASSRDGDDDIYIIGLDGTHQSKLTDNTAHDQLPAWVP